MADLATSVFGRQLESLFDGGSVAGMTDHQLLERFTTHRDAGAEAAFAALVARHGPIVLRICRQILGDRHHAEDAFQAVFLVLARNARSIRNPDLIGTWLYGVTLRTARKAKTRLRRQREKLEHDAPGGAGADGVAIVASNARTADMAAVDREQAEALHNEIERLPSLFRLPVLLCYFEGLTLDEAAQRLQWRPGTLRSRLARARNKLRRGLTRRGVVPSSGDLVMILGPRPVFVCVSSTLCDLATKTAIAFAAGKTFDKAVATSIATLAQEVLRDMLAYKMGLAFFTLLVLGAVATGVGSLALSLATADEPAKVRVSQPPVSTRTDVPGRAAPGRMLIVGRVLDPQGKSVVDASVMAYARLRSEQGEVTGQAHSDGSGAFRIETLRTASERHQSAGVVAIAPGYGVGWFEFNPDAPSPTADVSLRPEQVINGRLFDVQGNPARDVKVSVSAIHRIIQRNPDRRREQFEGPAFFRRQLTEVPAWPGPVTTDSEGRFSLHGIGRDLRTFLTVNDSRYAQQDIEIETDGNAGSKEVTLALQSAQFVTGRVTYADTGKPVPEASVNVRADKDGAGRFSAGVKTDTEGRFRENPPPGARMIVYAHPPKGQPYLGVLGSFDWPKGAVEHSFDLALPRGVLIRGKVTEQGSGKPIAGATVTLNPHSIQNSENRMSNAARTPEDGSYQLVAVPSAGYFAIEGPSSDYVLQSMSYRQYFEGNPGGPRIYAHAFVACDPKPGSVDLRVDLMLKRGGTVKGQVIGRDGQPVPDTWMISRIMLGPLGGIRQGWQGNQHGTARNGQFEIHGIDPDVGVPVYFLEPKRKLGATVHFSGKPASAGPLIVRLESCVTARARLVGPDGRPVAGFSKPWLISIVVTPGPFNSVKARKEGLMLADEGRLPAVDPINYEPNPVSDAQGRITFPALIPGASYRINDRTPFRGPDGPQVRKEFTVKGGETLDLGDILIDKPQL